MINAFFIIFLYIYFLLTGNGGDAGRIRLYFSKLRGQIALKTCRGKGGQAAKNGLGGAG